MNICLGWLMPAVVTVKKNFLKELRSKDKLELQKRVKIGIGILATPTTVPRQHRHSTNEWPIILVRPFVQITDVVYFFLPRDLA
jgi:hypothetical protein